MLTVAFDGPDGSGKTPCLAVVADMLVERGLQVHVCAPYRDLPIYELWEEAPLEAARQVRDVIDDNLEAAARNHRDLVLFDRHWPTAAVSTIDWSAVDLIRQSALDRLVLLVPNQPPAKVNDPNAGAWMVNGVDRHWVAYRCLAEGFPGVSRPRSNEQGRFNFRAIAQEIAWLCGV